MRRVGITRFICMVAACIVLAPSAVAQAPDGTTEDEAGELPEQPPIELVLRSDREIYAVGDTPSYFARASEDCYLTLINVDPDGSAVVLFPNEFEQDNRLDAGNEIKLPMPNSPYKLRVTKTGRERLIGICTQASRPVAGIHHDFDRLQFTMLGNWDEFLARVAKGETQKESAQPERRSRRGRGQASKKLEEPEPVVSDRQTRTEISYEVR